MKVLLIGATGNIGLRLIAALLTHNHQVVAYVRSASKLQYLVSEDIFRRLTVIQGSAKDSDVIKDAILDNSCDAVVNSAGVAAMAPWGKTDMPEIFRAVVEGICAAGDERGRALRTWVLGGLGVLHFPGTHTMLSSYIPIFLAHRQNLALLKSLPHNAIEWSMLCPSTMTAESSEIKVPAGSGKGKLVADATSPPAWRDSWLSYIPFFGKVSVGAMNASRYDTTLEQNAEFIAEDLAQIESKYIEKTVGVIDAAIS